MLYNAQEGKLHIGEVSFDYIQFGTGKKTLLMIHGLNTNGIKGAAFSLAYMYRLFAKAQSTHIGFPGINALEHGAPPAYRTPSAPLHFSIVRGINAIVQVDIV